MENIALIHGDFIEKHTVFSHLITDIKLAFASQKVIVPNRHHHDFPNPKTQEDTTLLLMPAWNPSENAGVKLVTISPKNGDFNLASVQGTYIYLDAKTGVLKAILEAKSLTTKRTAATSALASSFLSKKEASSLLMIGTGALSKNLIKAHASVRHIKQVYVWGRNFDKAQRICEDLKSEDFNISPVKTIEEKISEVDIISCATLSKDPLIDGNLLREGQHVDLVGAYKTDMREADDTTILKSSVFVDTNHGARESGDIVIPLQSGILKEADIRGNLTDLCTEKIRGRKDQQEITLFKSVGYALEDLVAADYYYKQFINE